MPTNKIKKRIAIFFLLYILGVKKKSLVNSEEKKITILIPQNALTSAEIQTEVDAILTQIFRSKTCTAFEVRL